MQDTIVYDAVAKLVIVNLLDTAGNSQVVSHDLGLTWSAPTSIGLPVSSDTGPGVGIQLGPSNPHAPGRLLFIGHSGAYIQDYVWYSDDHGTTYNLSLTATGRSLLKMDEAQLVELSNGDVLANMRNNEPQHLRGVALSTDGGTTFGEIQFDAGLPEPVCMGSVIRATDPALGDGAVYFSNPGSTAGRVGGLVRRSEHCTGLPPHDCTWADGTFSVYPAGDFAYSCLSPLNSTHVGLLWETNTSLCTGASCLQVFSAIPIASFAA
jgi:sialidase-1